MHLTNGKFIGSSFEQYGLNEVDRLYCECALLMEKSLEAASSNTFYTRLIAFTVNAPY